MQFLKYKNGQAALITVVFFLFISLAIVLGMSSIALRETRIARINVNAKQSYFLAEAGAEDAVYRITQSKNYNAIETLSLNGNTVITTVTDVGADRKDVVSQGDATNAIRTVIASLQESSGTSFAYGVQIGNGGLFMENNSIVNGNVYSNGNITGQNNARITGDATSGGTIGDPPIVNGTRTEGAPSLAIPIPDSDIDAWKSEAEAGSTHTSPCPYVLDGTDTATLGPLKINCDFTIEDSAVVTITGPIWVAGNFYLKNDAELKLDIGYGTGSERIIVDNPADRIASSKISVENQAEVLGSGEAGSYILLISQNNSAELGGDETAIQIKNSSSAPIYYASHGEILIQNNAALKEVSGYAIHIKNNAEVTYETGLVDINFSSGPLGGWGVEAWKEIK